MAQRHLHDPARLHVMHVITHLAMGGAENVAIGLCERLRDEMDFSVFAVIGGPLSAVGQDMVHRLDQVGARVITGTPGRFKSGGVLLAALKLAAGARAHRPDVIHLHTEIPELTAAVAGLLSRTVRRTPVLRTVHNSTLWIDWAGVGAWVTDRHAQARAVAVSQAAADADEQILTRQKRCRAEVIYNGVTPSSRAQGSEPETVQAMPATTEQAMKPVRVIFAGRLVEQKGADLLPDILRMARSLVQRDDVEVTIAGEGPLGEKLWQDLNLCAPRWQVALVPPIERLASSLAEYDALLMPSRFEGFALLPLEAMMSGVPMIVSRAPGIDEALPDGYPYVSASCDARAMGALLAQVLNAPEAARHSVQRFSAEISTRFSVERMTASYAQVYRESAAGRSHERAFFERPEQGRHV